MNEWAKQTLRRNTPGLMQIGPFDLITKEEISLCIGVLYTALADRLGITGEVSDDSSRQLVAHAIFQFKRNANDEETASLLFNPLLSWFVSLSSTNSIHGISKMLSQYWHFFDSFEVQFLSKNTDLALVIQTSFMRNVANEVRSARHSFLCMPCLIPFESSRAGESPLIVETNAVKDVACFFQELDTQLKGKQRFESQRKKSHCESPKECERCRTALVEIGPTAECLYQAIFLQPLQVHLESFCSHVLHELAQDPLSSLFVTPRAERSMCNAVRKCFPDDALEVVDNIFEASLRQPFFQTVLQAAEQQLDEYSVIEWKYIAYLCANMRDPRPFVHFLTDKLRPFVCTETQLQNTEKQIFIFRTVVCLQIEVHEYAFAGAVEQKIRSCVQNCLDDVVSKCAVMLGKYVFDICAAQASHTCGDFHPNIVTLEDEFLKVILQGLQHTSNTADIENVLEENVREVFLQAFRGGANQNMLYQKLTATLKVLYSVLKDVVSETAANKIDSLARELIRKLRLPERILMANALELTHATCIDKSKLWGDWLSYVEAFLPREADKIVDLVLEHSTVEIQFENLTICGDFLSIFLTTSLIKICKENTVSSITVSTVRELSCAPKEFTEKALEKLFAQGLLIKCSSFADPDPQVRLGETFFTKRKVVVSIE